MCPPMEETRDDRRLLRWVRPVVVLLVVLGCLFRFSGLTRMVFRNDEAHTGTVIAGARPHEIQNALFDGASHSPTELLEYQFPRPGVSWSDSIRCLFEIDPKQGPTYFVAARAWVSALGPSTVVLRSLGSLLGMVCLPLVYLLGRELFQDRLVGWVAAGLMAVSPLRIVYDREARPYALWALFILLCSWLLLIPKK